MANNSVADVLRALATGDKNRSETARLRDIVHEVEAALAAGVSRAAVLDALHAQGFTMTLKSFESALYRIRKRQERTATPPASQATTAPTGGIRHDEKTAGTPAAESREGGQTEPQARITNPADIRKSRRREIDLESLENGSDDKE